MDQMGSLTEPFFIAIIGTDRFCIMITDPQEEIFEDIAKSLKRIADALEKKWHIDIDHGHIEKIDNIEHGDIDTHHHSF